MKRKFVALIFAFAMVLSACSPFAGESSKTFDIVGYDMQIVANTAFVDATEGGNFSLQITNDRCYISVMAYSFDEMPEGDTPESIYKFHNEDIMGRRDDVELLVEETTEELEGKTVTHKRFSAVNDLVENYYDSYLVSFDDAEVFAWVLVTGRPSYIKIAGDSLKDIVYSISLT